jgi:hypothetical protein
MQSVDVLAALFAKHVIVGQRDLKEMRRSSRIDGRHPDLSLVAQHLKRHIVTLPAEYQVHSRLVETQAAQSYLVEEWRQSRVPQQDFVVVRIEFETKRRLQ